MTIGKKRTMEISLICYAEVSYHFAMFCNPKYRGENFKWSDFPEMMSDWAEIWLFTSAIPTNKENVQLAQSFAREIARRLVDRLND